MITKKLGKFDISQCTNGYILSLINPNYAPSGGSSRGSEGYILNQYIAATPEELSQVIITMLVEARLD